MDKTKRHRHWEEVYERKAETEVSWFEASPALSLGAIERWAGGLAEPVIDIGGGASRLADALLERGFKDITVLDLSEAALAAVKARLGERASLCTFIAADVTAWEPQLTYRIWHDRAAFHFLTDPEDRDAYRERLLKGLGAGGHAVIGTFALDGPEKCSGLPVVRYDATTLAKALGPRFVTIETQAHDHVTPAGNLQKFQFTVFRRIG